MDSFWNKLPRPFFALAPMADVTDPAFRKIIAKYGKPDVMWTEFVSADGLYHLNKIANAGDSRKSLLGERYASLHLASLSSGRHSSSPTPAFAANPLMRDLQFDASEHPIVAQIFGSNPETIAYATRLAADLGFDGVDINMGCPDRSIEKQEAGAAMMKSPAKAQEIIKAAQSASPLPVSVKTRIGYNREMLEEWLPALLEANPAAITLHLRTRKEMSAVPAHWELAPRAVKIREAVNPSVLLLGNGDVRNMTDAREKAASSGLDGVMLGRAIFGNPWLFSGRDESLISQQEKLHALVELAQEFEKLSPPKSFAILKKHIKAFVSGFDGAAELRARLMEAENAAQFAEIIK